MAALRRRKHKKEWIYYVDFMYEGKRRVWSTKTGDKRIARKILDDIKGKIARGTFNLEEYEKKHITLEEFLNDYIKSVKSDKRQKTVELEKLYLGRVAEYFGGNRNLRSIDRRIADQWRADFLSQKDRRFKNVESQKRVSASTFNIALRMIRHAFNVAKEWGFVDKNVFEGVREADVEERRLYLTDSEIDHLFGVIEEDLKATKEIRAKKSKEKMKWLFEFLLDTGLRRGEALALKITDVDLRENCIHIKQTKGKWDRSVPLTLRARQIILSLGKDLFQGTGKDYVTEKFRYYLRSANLIGFKLHSLRHTNGTRLHRAGVDIYTIAKLLGHRDIGTSLIYAKLTADTLQTAIKKLENLTGNVALMGYERREREKG